MLISVVVKSHGESARNVLHLEIIKLSLHLLVA